MVRAGRPVGLALSAGAHWLAGRKGEKAIVLGPFYLPEMSHSIW